MHLEILNKLRSLLESEDVLAVRREFNSLKSQFKSLPLEDPTVTDEKTENQDDAPTETGEPAPAGQSPAEEADRAMTDGVEEADDALEKAPEAEAPALVEPTTPPAESEAGETATADVQDEKTEKTEEAPKEPASAASKSETGEDGGKSSDGGAAAIDPVAIMGEFRNVVNAFNEKLKQTREAREKIEKETIAIAKDLLDEMKTLVEDEENIGKAFSRFNAIQARWKSLPKVSNDIYRDLNSEYNKYLEKFFYNINIYKELKELDLKRNLEKKIAVLENQKKLLDQNDIRLLEVEVRMNQDLWNEIGPTFREDWEKLKDEFWSVTRSIYGRIQDFYTEQRKEQEKNLEKMKTILESTRKVVDLNLKSTKKWHEKSEQIKELQKEWKMVGFVPRKDSKELVKEFRSLCDQFFDEKRAFHTALKKEQDANRDAKEALIKEAEALKDSENWQETTRELIALQEKWKSIGPAFQRDENRLWKRFRAACNHFFNRRNEFRDGRESREKENLEKKLALMEELDAFDVKSVEDPMASLKSFSDRWREIGHVPIKEKKKIDDRFDKTLNAKYKELNIDREQLRRLKFEEHVEDLKESKKSEHLLRKEEDIVRSKISRLESEIHQLENNMGFFADTKGAEKFKKDIQSKIDDARSKIAELMDQIQILRNA